MLKLSNETKIGILAVAAIALAIFGFKYLQGINVLKTSTTLKVRYANVDQLTPSSPVFVSGLQVGTVQELYIDPQDAKTIIAELNIESQVDIPKDAIATIVSASIMGGKAIRLDNMHPCSGEGCAEDGDFLLGTTESFISSLLGSPEELDPYLLRLQRGLGEMIDSLANPNNPKGIGRTILALNRSLENIAILTAKLNHMADVSTSGIAATANNAAEFTRALRASSGDITALLANLSAVSEQLKGANLDQGAKRAVTAIDSVIVAMGQLRSTLNTTEKTIAHVDDLATAMARGEGTAGKLLTDETLYFNIARATRQLDLLTQDLRLNPKRYTTVKLKVFGKNKTQGYASPLNDPAYELRRDSAEYEYYRQLDAYYRDQSDSSKQNR